MLCVLSFHAGDHGIALRLAQWMTKLGGVKGHELLIVLPKNLDGQDVEMEAQRAFGKATTIRHYADPSGWPQGPNMMFDYAVRYIEEKMNQPFIWLEPDAIPLPGPINWLDAIAAAYQECLRLGMKFMGDYVDVRAAGHPDGVNHMSGVAVYPASLSQAAPSALNNDKVAWDVVAAAQILLSFHRTLLIEHRWKAESFTTPESVKTIRSQAVLFHQCKDGSLIDRLEGIEPKNPVQEHVEMIARVVRENISPSEIERMNLAAESNVVTTFYDPLPKLRDDRLLEIWKSNWEAFGWRVRVVTKEDARAMDETRYSRYAQSQNLYGGSCGSEYLFLCYVRWLCMLGGGIMVDFDVFNYGFTPETYRDLRAALPTERVIHLSGDATPCATFGTAAAYERYVQCFDAYDANPDARTPHLKANVHDLNIIDANPQVWTGLKMCSLHPIEERWDRYPLTHFTHGHVDWPRSEKVASLRAFQPFHRLVVPPPMKRGRQMKKRPKRKALAAA